MSDRAFNSILDELLLTRKITGDPGLLDEMDEGQRAIIQAVKRSMKRLNK